MTNSEGNQPTPALTPTAATAFTEPYHPHAKHGVDLSPGASSSQRGSQSP
ncbi:hypothetical protein [Halomonas casei]